ncbi:MAG: hypothetical protein Kapaf2KO_02940 [Candidatus Kapaibacteriales bacterium]
MSTISLEDFKKDAEHYYNMIMANEPLLVKGMGKKPFVCISLDEYESLQLTEFENRSSVNRNRLESAIERAEAKEYIVKELDL